MEVSEINRISIANEKDNIFLRGLTKKIIRMTKIIIKANEVLPPDK